MLPLVEQCYTRKPHFQPINLVGVMILVSEVEKKQYNLVLKLL